MKCFQTLSLPITTNEKEIKKAYHLLLPENSPEMNPDGFRILREAYEEAIAYAKSVSSTTTDFPVIGFSITSTTNSQQVYQTVTPVDQFMAEFCARYDDYEKMVDATAWEHWLNSQSYCDISTKDIILERVLIHQLEKPFLPQPALQLFAEYFEVGKKISLLEERFHPNYLRTFLDSAYGSDTFLFEELLSNKVQAHPFLALFEQARNVSIDSNENEQQFFQLLDQMNALFPDQTNTLHLKARYFKNLQKYDEVEAILNVLESRALQSIELPILHALVLYEQGKLVESKPYFEKAIDRNYAALTSLYYLAKCSAAEGDWKSAFQYYFHALDGGLQDDNELENKQLYVKKFIEVSVQSEEYQQLIGSERDEAHLYYANLCLRAQLLDDFLMYLPTTADIVEQCSQFHYLMGTFHFLKENLIESEHSFRKAVAIEPSSANLQNSLANVLHDLKRHEDAIEIYERYLADQPDDLNIMNNCAHAFNQIGRFEDAIHMTSRLIAIDASYAYAYKNRAVALFETKRYTEAITDCTRCIGLDPMITEAYQVSINSRLAIEQFEEIRPMVDKVKELGLFDLPFQRYWIGINETYLAWPIVLENYLDLLVRGIDLKDTYAKVVNCYYQLEDNENAIRYAKKALYYGYSSNQLISYYVSAMTNLKQYKNVIQFYMCILEDYPDAEKEVYYSVAHCYAKLRKKKKAIAIYDKAIAMNYPIDGSDTYQFRIDLYCNMKKFKIAQELVQEGVALFPIDSDMIALAGYVYFCQRQYTKAIEFYNKALAIKQEINTQYRKLYVFVKMKDYRNGKQAAIEALEFTPEDEELWNYLAEFTLKSNKLGEYDDVLQRWLENNPDSTKGNLRRKQFTKKYKNIRMRN